jgi:hypothetical protein
LIVDRYGDFVEVANITLSDFAIYLGFNSRQSIYDYEAKEVRVTTKGNDGKPKETIVKPFAYILGRARLFIEREYEELLRESPAAAMFVLGNIYKWKI